MRSSALVVTSFVSLVLGAAAFACDPAAELAVKRAALATRTADMAKPALAKEHYLLGVWARQHGLENEARTEFRAALAADASHDAAHEALGEVFAGDGWVAHDEAMTRKGLVLRDGRWILKEEAAILDLPAQERARRVQEGARVTKLLQGIAGVDERAQRFAKDALAGVEDKYKLDPLAYALRSKAKDVRLYAASELGRLADRRAIRPLLWRAVHDPDESVRAASVAAAKAIGDPNLAVPLGTALWSESPQIRMNAAQALGNLGEPIGVKYLVFRYSAHGGSSQRVQFSTIKQVSFIQDFDVEVAQSAFIADPVVGTVQEGMVLDVQVVATSAEGEFLEREVVYSSLRKLTGASAVKSEPAAWAAWWKEHGKDYDATAR